MRAERLGWADRPKVVDAERRVSDRTAAAIAHVSRRKRLIHRSSIRLITRGVDAIVLFLVILGLTYSHGIDLWRLPVLLALPFLLLPVLAVGGVYVAGGYRFRYAGSVAGHLLRATVGVVVGLGAGFLLSLATGFPLPALFANVCAICAIALVSLHANYLGMVRAATRQAACCRTMW